MKIEIKIADKAYRPFDKIDIQVIFENDGAQQVIVPKLLGYIPSFNNESKEGTTGKESLEKYPTDNTLKPNEKVIYRFEQFIELCFISEKKSIITCEFNLKISTANLGKEISKPINIDFSDYQRIKAQNGEWSNYYQANNTLFYYSTYSRAYEPAITVLKGKPNDYTVLNKNYAITDKKVFNDGRLVRGVSAAGFQVFNSLFSGNEEIILTRYGKAKVEHPKTLKVLDDGLMPSPFSFQIDGYRCGYAIDKEFAYYFDESTSTGHAIRIRACKNPSELQSLGFAFAKDDKTVFWEGKKITKAKPDTFKIINRNYATDGKHIFYHRDIVDNADIESFEILPTQSYPRSPDPILNSSWAKDKNHYYQRGYTNEKSKYEKHLKE